MTVIFDKSFDQLLLLSIRYVIPIFLLVSSISVWNELSTGIVEKAKADFQIFLALSASHGLACLTYL